MATPDVHTDFRTVINERRSIRGYKPIPVPRELIEEVIEIAKRAPSSMNTQPWHFHVVTGDPLEKIREGKVQAAGAVIGAVMQAMKGQADAARVRELVLERANA